MEKVVKAIHENSMKILETVGVKFHHPDAIKVLKEHEISVSDDGVAKFTENQIMEWVQKAPKTATLYAADPKYNVTFGSGKTYIAPCAGATEIMNTDGSIRQANLDDMVKMIKLFETNARCDINGGTPCQPKEVPSEIATVLLHYIAMNLTTKSLWTATGTYAQMETIMQMTMARYGITKEEMMEKPRVFTMVNTNTPLQFDINMSETLFTYLKYRQPVAITAAAMGGTTAPVTLAGELSVINAEVIATVALAQMYAPGAPVLYGSQSTSADMRSCSIAIGSPEGALCYKYAKEMAAFYGIPCRAGGSLSDAKTVNAQAGYESMLTFMACEKAGVDVVVQSAGIMDGYLSVSYEKMMVDFEVINFVDRYLKDVDVDDEEKLALETIQDVGPAGQFLMEEHTFEYCREELAQPTISNRGPHSDRLHAFEQNIATRMEKLLDSYESRILPCEINETLKKQMREFGIEEQYFELADNCLK